MAIKRPMNVSDNLTGKHRYEAEERIARDIFPGNPP